jgi:transposase
MSDDRTQEMARMYVEQGMSYAEIGKHFNLTRARVGQILGPLKLAPQQVSRRRAERAQELREAHARIMARESTLAEEAEKLGYVYRENLRAELAKLGLRVHIRPVPEHGTRERYTSRKWRCRCEACRTANAEYARSLKNQDPPAHGVSGYQNYACRCKVCKEAWRLHERSRRAARRRERKVAA